jgi:hypothetical protein
LEVYLGDYPERKEVMDPDAAWNELGAALRANDLETARDYAGSLLTWLDGGGFPPHDLNEADIDDEARCFAVRRRCLAVLNGTTHGG